MLRDYTLQSTLTRALIALIVGALIGAALITGLSLFDTYQTAGTENLKATWLSTALSNFTVGLAIWGIALLLIGAPVWAAAHFLGLRTWLAALITGFALPTFMVLSSGSSFLGRGKVGRFDGQHFQVNTLQSLQNAAIFGLIGAATALTIWHIAYRRPPPC